MGVTYFSWFYLEGYRRGEEHLRTVEEGVLLYKIVCGLLMVPAIQRRHEWTRQLTLVMNNGDSLVSLLGWGPIESPLLDQLRSGLKDLGQARSPRH